MMIFLVTASGQSIDRHESYSKITIYALPRGDWSGHRITIEGIKEMKSAFMTSRDFDQSEFASILEYDKCKGSPASVDGVDIKVLIELTSETGAVLDIAISGNNLLQINSEPVYQLKKRAKLLRPIRKYIPNKYGWR
jgi:hypothetical protein